MVIDLPKGASNQTKLGAKPGTQQKALNDAQSGGGYNPNMPILPQAAKKAKSGFNQGLTGVKPQGPSKQPKPAPKPSPIISQGLPADPSQGYNIFSGMDAGQITQMNDSMGLSNMTALPALGAAGKDPAKLKRKFGAPEQWGDPQTAEYAFTTPESEIVAQEIAALPSTQDYLDSSPPTGTDEWYDTTENYGLGPKPVQGEDEHDDVFEARLANWQNAYQIKQAEAQKYYAEKEAEGAYNLNPAYDWTEPDAMYQEAWEWNTTEELGMDPGKKAEIFAQIDSQGARKLEMALDRADKIAAMSGTHGSGAHMTSMNNAVAQVLTELAGQYAEINKIDADMFEKDQQDRITNAIALATGTRADDQMRAEIADLALSTMVQPLGVWINDENRNFDDATREYLQSKIDYYVGLYWHQFWQPGEDISVAMQNLSEFLKEMWSGIYFTEDDDGNRVYSYQTPEFDVTGADNL